MAKNFNRNEIDVRVGEDPQFEAFLSDRIYEYNAAATGYHDAEVFHAAWHSDSGAVEAGVSGYTWGGCCFVSYLWVHERLRREGLGTALLLAVEAHARKKRCVRILLSSHSFQAPAFYARNGFEQVGAIADHPIGHADVFYAKRLGR